MSELLKHARYVRSFAARRLVHTNLQILYTCNFRCRICDFWKPPFTESPRLSADQVRVISDKLAEVGPQIVSIGGGEPLLHPELVEIVRSIGKHHFPVMICNGWYMTPEKARALFEAGMHEISISVDYADPALHDHQRGTPGAFERAIRALRVLIAARTRPSQRVHMISVVMSDNVDHLERLAQLSRELGVTYLVTMLSTLRGRLDSAMPPAGISERLLDLKRRYPEFVQLRGYLERFSQAVAEHGIGPCHTGKNLCNIDSQGNVTLCIDRLDEPVGNILAEEMSAIRDKLLQRHRENSCRACWTSCRGTVETLMYGGRLLRNLSDFRLMVRRVPLQRDGARTSA